MYALNIEDVADKHCASVARRKTLSEAHPSLEGEPFGIIELLDQFIPLDGASHTEVASYTVEIPMRYAKCFALLTNGEKVGLRRPQQFVGWSGWSGKRSFLFASMDILFEIKTDTDHSAAGHVPGNIQGVTIETVAVTFPNCKEYIASARDSNGDAIRGQLPGQRKFIAIDGSQIVLPPAN